MKQSYEELVRLLAISMAEKVFERRTESLQTEMVEECSPTTYMSTGGVEELEFFANEALPEDVFYQAKAAYLKLVTVDPNS